MVGNMASIFTEVYIAKVTPIYGFFPHLLHTVQFTSLSLLWGHVDIFMVIFICSCYRPNVEWGFCLPFSKWKSNNQSNCNLKSKVKKNILLFVLPCWSLAVQNEAFTMLVFTKYQRMYFHALTEKWPTSYFIYIFHDSVVSWMFVADVFGSHYDPISCLWEQHGFVGVEFVLTGLTILLSCQTVATKFELPSWYDL